MLVDIKLLLERCTPACTQAMQEAALLASGHGHAEVTPEHLLLSLCGLPDTDFRAILAAYGIDTLALAGLLEKVLEHLDDQPRAAGRPVIAAELAELLQQAWLLGSLELGETRLRSGALILALLREASPPITGAVGDLLRRQWRRALRGIPADSLRARFKDIVKTASAEAAEDGLAVAGMPPGSSGGAGGPGVSGSMPPLVPGSGEGARRFCVDLTERARAGEIDPVFGREEAMRRIMDILARRRKNNPLLVGDAGVGKTAVVEGMALKLVEAEAQGWDASGLPVMLRGVRLLALDMGSLEAGAGLKGEFEERLKAVMEDVRQAETPTILFIDEAHTLIGAGGRPGGSDAANFLKPVLARGEIKIIAATTWSEHKRVFSRDQALTRRFQPVPLEEPTEEVTIEILRGLKPRYEADHGVAMRDDAVVAAARFATRYIPDRFLPDKAVDLLDTAAARVKVSLTAKPARIEESEQHILDLRRRVEALTRDKSHGLSVDEDALNRAWRELKELKTRAWTLGERWRAEQALVRRLLVARDAMQAERQAQGLPREETRREALALLEELNQVQQGRPLVRHEVDPEMVAQVVHEWTGIPMATILRDQSAAVLALEKTLRSRVKGQDQALAVCIREIQAAASGLKDEGAPLAVLLLAGPSGVGKTETGRALAEALFGGEQTMLQLHMGEFSEKHSVSRLIGSPPGYVGYGEGGVLTEAVRRRPHSLVLLDEAEKAHPEVLNLFHQVFEQGVLADAEGRPVDFRNVLFVLTSNAGAETALTEPGLAELDWRRRAERLEAAIWPALREAFPASLLGRMTVAPFGPLDAAALVEVAERKLARLAAQALVQGARGGFILRVAPEVAASLAARCRDPESGARGVDKLIRAEVLPRLAAAALARQARVAGQYGQAGQFARRSRPGGETPGGGGVLSITVDKAGEIVVCDGNGLAFQDVDLQGDTASASPPPPADAMDASGSIDDATAGLRG